LMSLCVVTSFLSPSINAHVPGKEFITNLTGPIANLA
jgi:hypothetical protein